MVDAEKIAPVVRDIRNISFPSLQAFAAFASVKQGLQWALEMREKKKGSQFIIEYCKSMQQIKYSVDPMMTAAELGFMDHFSLTFRRGKCKV